MNIPKPVYVAGYVRNKKEIETAQRRAAKADRADAIFAGLMVGSMLVIVAVILWQVTLTIAATVIAGILIKKWIAKKIAERREALQLNINYYWRRNWYENLLWRLQQTTGS